MSGFCICSICGERVPVEVFNSGGHECPDGMPPQPIKGESFDAYKARQDAHLAQRERVSTHGED